jgi:hypothetical protein
MLTTTAPKHPSAIRRAQLRRLTVRVLNPTSDFPARTVRGDVAARMVAHGLARHRQRGAAIWVLNRSEVAPGVVAGSLPMATARELRGVPIVAGWRLLIKTK